MDFNMFDFISYQLALQAANLPACSERDPATKQMEKFYGLHVIAHLAYYLLVFLYEIMQSLFKLNLLVFQFTGPDACQRHDSHRMEFA